MGGEKALRATAFLFVVGISLTTLTPAPHLVGELGQVNGMRLLTFLATTSAIAEIALSPIIGGLSDSSGRKPVLIGTLASALVANAAVAVAPCIATVALSKFVGGAVVGVFFLASGAILADAFRTEPTRLAAASGILFALVNAGFGVGIAQGKHPAQTRNCDPLAKRRFEDVCPEVPGGVHRRAARGSFRRGGAAPKPLLLLLRQSGEVERGGTGTKTNAGKEGRVGRGEGGMGGRKSWNLSSSSHW